MNNRWRTTWRITEYDNYIGIWPNEGVGWSNGYAPMARVVGDKRWVDAAKRKEIAELMASAPDLKANNERLREEVEHYKKDNIRLKTDKMVLFRALMKIRSIEGGDVFEMIKEMKSIANIAIKEMG